MATGIGNILRSARRKSDDTLNILTFPTHEPYETALCATGHSFFSVTVPNVTRSWNLQCRPLPQNYVLLDASREADQLPLDIDLDLVLSHNRFGQFTIAEQFCIRYHVPHVCMEHTLPSPDWNKEYIDQTRELKADVNLFISEYNLEQWGWNASEASVIHHGIDNKVYSPNPAVAKKRHILSVVNDWINRDWCCFVAGTRIPLLNGEIKNIEAVTLKDELYCDNQRAINTLIKREYSGPVIEIDFGYGNTHTVTPEHPYVLANQTVVNANQLKSGDNISVHFPKLNTHINLANGLSGKYKIINGNIKCLGNNSTEGTNQIIPITTDLLDFLGWYIAEGSVTKNNIEFDLSSEELNIAEKLIEYGHTIGVNGFIKNNSVGDSIRVIFVSKPMAEFLSKTFGSNSHTKRIPPCFLNKECVPLFKALINGDGSQSVTRLKFDSCSKNLVESVFMFFSQFGIIGKFSQYERTGFGITSQLYTVTYNGNRLSTINELFDNVNIAAAGIAIKTTTLKLAENITVYNFNVSDDNLYSTLYGTTHNCGYKIWERVTKGLPIHVRGNTPGLSTGTSSIGELVNEYRAAQIFLNTSTVSPVPMALLEAMSCGCAVVTTATCMLPEIIENGVNGFISNNEETLRAYLVKLLDDKELCKKLGAAARETVKMLFSPMDFVHKWDNVLHKAAEIPPCSRLNLKQSKEKSLSPSVLQAIVTPLQ